MKSGSVMITNKIPKESYPELNWNIYIVKCFLKSFDLKFFSKNSYLHLQWIYLSYNGLGVS